MSTLSITWSHAQHLQVILALDEVVNLRLHVLHKDVRQLHSLLQPLHLGCQLLDLLLKLSQPLISLRKDKLRATGDHHDR